MMWTFATIFVRGNLGRPSSSMYGWGGVDCTAAFSVALFTLVVVSIKRSSPSSSLGNQNRNRVAFR